MRITKVILLVLLVCGFAMGEGYLENIKNGWNYALDTYDYYNDAWLNWQYNLGVKVGKGIRNVLVQAGIISSEDNNTFIKKLKEFAKTYINPTRLTMHDLDVVLHGIRLVASPLKEVTGNVFVDLAMSASPYGKEWFIAKQSVNQVYNLPDMKHHMDFHTELGIRLAGWIELAYENPEAWQEALLKEFPALSKIIEVKKQMEDTAQSFSLEKLGEMIKDEFSATSRLVKAAATTLRHAPTMSYEHLSGNLSHVKELTDAQLQKALAGISAITSPIVTIVNDTHVDRMMSVVIGSPWKLMKSIIIVVNDVTKLRQEILKNTPFGRFLFHFVAGNIQNPDNWHHNLAQGWPELDVFLKTLEKANAARPPVRMLMDRDPYKSLVKTQISIVRRPRGNTGASASGSQQSANLL